MIPVKKEDGNIYVRFGDASKTYDMPKDIYDLIKQNLNDFEMSQANKLKL